MLFSSIKFFFNAAQQWEYQGPINSLASPSRTWTDSGGNIYSVDGSATIKKISIQDKTVNWINISVPGTATYNGIYGTSDDNIYAVGTGGSIAHFNGHTWTTTTYGTTTLNGVWGSSANNIIAVGNSGLIMHFNGTSWNTMNSGTSNALYDIFGTASNNVYAGGDSGLMLHYNGTGWSSVGGVGTTYRIMRIYGSKY